MTGKPEDITGRLSDFITTSLTADWPEETLELGRRHILDTIASIVVCGDRETARLAREFVVTQSGSVAAGAPILGTTQTAALRDAVFASALIAHGAEINDFCPSAFVQPGPSVVSSALCVAAMHHLAGRDVLRAVVTGYELTCRIPKALGIKRSRRLGYSTHGYGPVFGTAATVASLRRLSVEQVNFMLSYCCQQASGSMQWLLDVGHMEKSFVFAGMPARNGIDAALLAEAGFTGVPNAMDARGGWFDAFMFRGDDSDYDPHYLVDGLGSRFEMPLVAYKRYPVGGPTQPVVQALHELVSQVDVNDVRSVEIEMPGSVGVFANAAMPALNLPYLCAVILLDGLLSFDMADSLARKSGDATVQALMKHVSVRHDPAQEAVPRKESARVTIHQNNGNSVSHFVEHVRGYPPDPMSRQDVEDKARELMTPVLGAARTNTLIAQVWQIERLEDAGVLATAMAPLVT